MPELAASSDAICLVSLSLFHVLAVTLLVFTAVIFLFMILVYGAMLLSAPRKKTIPLTCPKADSQPSLQHLRQSVAAPLPTNSPAEALRFGL